MPEVVGAFAEAARAREGQVVRRLVTLVRTALGLLLLCLVVTSCGLMRRSMDIDYNDQFHEHTEREFIEKTVGATTQRQLGKSSASR
ncbi:hypothetical protein BST28_11085 [Mycolicibacter kumamotonensis]|jgi:hypothetical protein|uniref:Uncharacterized protein n=1 Tax=Mycolicibacter kumamotonensis TaxID=354243 RepID=A0A1X0E4P5_9MYCO|nr:hypothetical protein [Mycolicibacter kumamotonensis]ORA79673.1 hypothetical protein BST28_11085 [Mycolicibacter kumamotonensis]